MKKIILLVITAVLAAFVVSCDRSSLSGNSNGSRPGSSSSPDSGSPDSGSPLPEVIRTPPVDKRGVSYSFEQENTPEEDMALLAPAVKWFYNWYIIPKPDVEQAAKKHEVAFYPMVWNSWNFEGHLSEYLVNNPDCEYILGYNEPNLTDQANMTPAKAALTWPTLVRVAKKYGLKIVSPAMNFGTLRNYWVPWVWLNEFFGIDYVNDDGVEIKNRGYNGVSLDDIDAIAIHCYMSHAGAIKWFIGMFKSYNKPIWMTEFCSWEGTNSLEWQMEVMSESVIYMELDPAVEKYAWFIPKSSELETALPMNKLLTRTNPPQLTPLGYVYVNMGTCDKNVWVPAGQRIEAKDFADCNLSEWINVEGWPSYDNGGSVHFRPKTDIDGVLDTYDFTSQKWLEYQIDAPETKTYTLTLRSIAPEATTIEIYVDGEASGNISLQQSGAWTTSAVTFQMEAGHRKLRLKAVRGNCALNWLKVE